MQDPMQSLGSKGQVRQLCRPVESRQGNQIGSSI
ncbi:hypothetical protein Vi05172_g3343 [Venturia inaequalis]|nr:hypothetical protein Vi05172_g3343 [Venturia inaequalis]